jgi:ACR3 family arsenite efflux pump ArsB
MNRETLERHQVWLHLAAIGLGLAAGSVRPDLGPQMEAALWPFLAALLYVTFTQVPLDRLPEAWRDSRFMLSVVLANFALVPLLVWAILPTVPADPAVRLGVLLVLLVPCTDWFITFAHLARGDTRRAIAVSPLNLVLQLVLLPLWLWLFLGRGFSGMLDPLRIGIVFLLLIVAPLAAALATQTLAGRFPARGRLFERLGRLPVPLLAVVVFLIAGSQAETAAASLPVLGQVLAAFVLFLAGGLAIGIGVARLFALPSAAARTLVFSVATRNSFVVLPFALALPPAWHAAVVVIVFQSLVELLGMVVFLRLVPRLLP